MIGEKKRVNNSPLISILIPCRAIDLESIESAKKCLELDYENVEVFLLPDKKSDLSIDSERLTIIPTGIIPPSRKRMMALEFVKGDLIALLDSDAFPEKLWLSNAIPFFSNEEIGAVGGPSITPENDNIMSKAGGIVLSSKIGGGNLSFRYSSKKEISVDDLPSCNLIIRKSLIDDMGGFACDYWPGEDTYLCLQIKKLGFKIIYSPKVKVYHHRRPLFRKHLKQIWDYGLHRGFFSKKFPQNSRKIFYFFQQDHSPMLKSACVWFIAGRACRFLFAKWLWGRHLPFWPARVCPVTTIL